MPLTGDYLRRAIAEFVGTFALVFVAVGSLIYSDVNGAALAYGFVVAVMVCAVGHVSGGHLNPAVTLGFVLTRRISPPLALVYLVVQFAAGIAAAALLKWLLAAQLEDGISLGAPALISSSGITVTSGQGVVIEAVLTFFVVWVVFATAVDPRGTFKQVAGLAVGFTVAAGVFFASRLTGAAMNPARALGPELIGNHWKDAWVWYLGPFAGGAVASVLYELLFLRPARPTVVGTPGSEVDEPRPGDAALS
jgi:aquaporin Z